MSTKILAGRYELIEKIGDGGMAVVYKSRDRLLNRYVAIKILKPEFTKDMKFIDNFRKESQAAASLSHPNIVAIYDVGREGNIHYIVMELVEGEPLSELIRREGPLDWRRTVDIAKQITSALSLAHKNHIIHRDVKPHNILMASDGTAKITDFGIAKALDSSTMGDNTGTIMGSVHYFSPEQARGGYVDEKSDIYSLGIVIYEMLVGRVPFDGENPVQVALMHINEEITPPSELVDGIPPGLEQVVMKATNKYQVNRYSSADEMLGALSNVEMVANLVGDSVFAGSKPQTGQVVGAGAEAAGVGTAAAQAAEGEGEAAGTTAAKGDEQVKKGEEKKKFFTKTRLLAALLALVCAIPVSLLISNAIGSGETPSPIPANEELLVPSFVGMTVESATTLAGEYELKIREGDHVYSSDYDEGLIVSQDPAAETKVKPGKTITVSISKGSKEGTIPNIVGKSSEDAKFILEKYGYKVGTVSSVKSSVPGGIVISQSVEAGTEAIAGTVVSFTVSENTGKDERIVPRVVGKTLEEAKASLEKAGFVAGEITYEESSEFEDGVVIWQQYGADTAEEAGTAMALKVAGPAPEQDENTGGEGAEGTEGGEGDEDPSVVTEPVSGTVAIPVSFDKAEHEVFYITVTVSDAEGTRNLFTGSQRLKSDGGETVTIPGTGAGTVSISFDNVEVARYSVDFGAETVN